MNKSTITCSIGTLIEWAEFTFYAYMSYKFAPLFFPMFQANTAILASFGTFAISYFARPLGSILFGHIGDKHGRKKAFSLSIFLMAITTLSMGILPTYNLIGIAAPLLLILLRFLQGIAVAGEFTGAAVYMVESSNYNKPYLSSSWVSTASAAGMLLGAFAALIIALPSMPTWTWRIPFFIGSFACLLGFYIRKNLSETAEYSDLNRTHNLEKLPLITVLTNYKIQILQTAALAAFVGIYIYICNIWWASYVVEQHYFSNLEAKTLTIIGQGSVVILIPFMAILAERYSGRLIMSLGFVGAIIIAPLLFFASSTQIFYMVLAMHIVYAICNSAVTAPMFKFLADIFPASIRYTGQALGWNVSVALFGGTAPLFAQYLFSQGLNFLPGIYVSLSALTALSMCIIFFKKK
jgi:MHS family proline/betaine transporter-like MFS transporter